MNRATESVTALRTRLESEVQTADGRTVQLCRDAHGGYWIVDEAERVMSVHEFGAQCLTEGRLLRAAARAETFRRVSAGVKCAFQGIVKALKTTRAKPAHA